MAEQITKHPMHIDPIAALKRAGRHSQDSHTAPADGRWRGSLAPRTGGAVGSPAPLSPVVRSHMESSAADEDAWWLREDGFDDDVDAPEGPATDVAATGGSGATALASDTATNPSGVPPSGARGPRDTAASDPDAGPLSGESATSAPADGPSVGLKPRGFWFEQPLPIAPGLPAESQGDQPTVAMPPLVFERDATLAEGGWFEDYSPPPAVHSASGKSPVGSALHSRDPFASPDLGDVETPRLQPPAHARIVAEAGRWSEREASTSSAIDDLWRAAEEDVESPAWGGSVSEAPLTAVNSPFDELFGARVGAITSPAPLDSAEPMVPVPSSLVADTDIATMSDELAEAQNPPLPAAEDLRGDTGTTALIGSPGRTTGTQATSPLDAEPTSGPLSFDDATQIADVLPMIDTSTGPGPAAEADRPQVIPMQAPADADQPDDGAHDGDPISDPSEPAAISDSEVEGDQANQPLRDDSTVLRPAEPALTGGAPAQPSADRPGVDEGSDNHLAPNRGAPIQPAHDQASFAPVSSSFAWFSPDDPGAPVASDWPPRIPGDPNAQTWLFDEVRTRTDESTAPTASQSPVGISPQLDIEPASQFEWQESVTVSAASGAGFDTHAIHLDSAMDLAPSSAFLEPITGPGFTVAAGAGTASLADVPDTQGDSLVADPWAWAADPSGETAFSEGDADVRTDIPVAPSAFDESGELNLAALEEAAGSIDLTDPVGWHEAPLSAKPIRFDPRALPEGSQIDLRVTEAQSAPTFEAITDAEHSADAPALEVTRRPTAEPARPLPSIPKPARSAWRQRLPTILLIVVAVICVALAINLLLPILQVSPGDPGAAGPWASIPSLPGSSPIL